MTFYIVRDPHYADSPLIATVTREQAEHVSAHDFGGEGVITRVTEAALIAEGFDPRQVREENPT